MDEPTVAVDPQSRNKILEGIQTLNHQGSTIIYTSHYMEEVEQICTRIAIMDHGRVIAQGTKEELKQMIKTGETITVEAIALEEKISGISAHWSMCLMCSMKNRCWSCAVPMRSIT